MKILKIKKIVALSSLILVASFYGISASAQTSQETSYKLLAPLPCVGNDCGQLAEETVLSKYLPGIFKLAVGLSAAFAVLMIVVGGFQYMSTDAFQGKKEGLERVQNAVKGLILVIGAGLILSEINPELLKLNLNLSPVSISAPTGGSGGSLGGTGNVTQRVAATCPTCGNVRTDFQYNMPQSYINGLSCSTCAPIAGNIPMGRNTNTNVLPDTNTRLVNLSGNLPSNMTWYVSEAYPPVIQHANGCHQRGTCVDVSLGTSPATAANVNAFLNASRNAGLRAIYEVRDNGAKQQLVNSGVPASSIMVVSTINGNHFSVYNCNSDAQSCANLP